MVKLQARTKELNGTSRELSRRVGIDKGSERALDYLKTFCHRVKDGLGTMSFGERQDLLKSVVESISVENETVRVETIIPFGDNDNQSRTRHGEPVEPPAAQ